MADALAPGIDTETTSPAQAASASRPPMRLGARSLTHAGWVLAPDEAILWEGRPAALALAIRAFRLPVVAAYFGALAAWGSVEFLLGRTGIGSVAMPLASGLLTLAALLGVSLLVARTTTYLVTTDRVILRYGAALSRSLSIPFRQVAALHVSVGRRGRGDIALTLRRGNRIPYLKLWPHVRPWRLRHPEPMLCGVADAALTATRLARRLGAEGEQRRSSPPGSSP